MLWRSCFMRIWRWSLVPNCDSSVKPLDLLNKGSMLWLGGCLVFVWECFVCCISFSVEDFVHLALLIVLWCTCRTHPVLLCVVSFHIIKLINMFWIAPSRFRMDLWPKKSKHYGTLATHASGSRDQIRQWYANHTEMHTTPLMVLCIILTKPLL